MSRLSIYETQWIDLVFENKNKEYGAYQLRRKSVKNSLTALFMGLLFVASLGGILTIVKHFNQDVSPVVTIPEWSEPIKLTAVNFQKITKSTLPEVQNLATKATITKEQLINPIVVHSEDAIKEIAANTENKNASNVISEGTGTVGLNPSNSTGAGNEISNTIDYGSTIVNPLILDKRPEFPGGMAKFYTYVSTNFEKPEIDGIETIRVLVSFVIEKDGSMTDIQVIGDPGYGLGREAVRVLKSVKTKWTPGIIGSKAVRTSFNLPIMIQIN